MMAEPSRLIRASEVTPKAVEWAWRRYIPLAKVTLLDGDPGNGKSLSTLDLAARITTGRKMPDGTRGLEPADTIVLTLEDDAEDTVVPRLILAGADLTRVHLLNVDAWDPDLPEATGELREEIERWSAVFVVVDPLFSFLSGKVNSYSDHEVRRALGPLHKLAKETGAAVVVVRHLRKSNRSNAVLAGGGSIGIIGATRSALVVGKDPRDPALRVLAVNKPNLAAEAPSMSYRIEGEQVMLPSGSLLLEEDGTPASVGRVSWKGRHNLRADQLFIATGGKREKVKAALQTILGDGPRPGKEVRRELEESGFARNTVYKAAEELGVEMSPEGFQGQSMWSLPE